MVMRVWGDDVCDRDRVVVDRHEALLSLDAFVVTVGGRVGRVVVGLGYLGPGALVIFEPKKKLGCELAARDTVMADRTHHM